MRRTCDPRLLCQRLVLLALINMNDGVNWWIPIQFPLKPLHDVCSTYENSAENETLRLLSFNLRLSTTDDSTENCPLRISDNVSGRHWLVMRVHCMTFILVPSTDFDSIFASSKMKLSKANWFDDEMKWIIVIITQWQFIEEKFPRVTKDAAINWIRKEKTNKNWWKFLFLFLCFQSHLNSLTQIIRFGYNKWQCSLENQSEKNKDFLVYRPLQLCHFNHRSFCVAAARVWCGVDGILTFSVSFFHHENTQMSTLERLVPVGKRRQTSIFMF